MPRLIVPLSLTQKEVDIAYIFIVALCASLLVAVIALSRERRQRLGLQAILNRILEHWKLNGENQHGRRHGHSRSRRQRVSRRRKQTDRRNGGKES